MNVGSLFSGIGGIEKGFEAEGFKTKWFVENNPFCQTILRKHWPEVPIYGDIRKIDFTKLEPVDILTGGFPCEEISNAGTRIGITGPRSGLWKEFFRAIREIRPKIAFVENVSALTYRGLSTVLGDLSEIWYNAEWSCLPAGSLGAPHRRDRIYIIAYRNSNGFNRTPNEKNGQPENGFNAMQKSLGNSESGNAPRGKKRTIEKQSKGETRSPSYAGPPNMAHSDCGGLEGTITKKRNGVDAFRSSETTKILANSNGPFLEGGRERETERVTGTSGLSDCNRNGRHQKTEQRTGSTDMERIKRNVSYAYNSRRWQQCKKSLFEKNKQETWATDAGILRVSNGVSNRIYRISALGRAVVPQVAQFFAKQIKEAEGL